MKQRLARQSIRLNCRCPIRLLALGINDEYLCIVASTTPDKSNVRIYLPFEGDRLLSIIISKALLLADDDKITDQTILRQIHK